MNRLVPLLFHTRYQFLLETVRGRSIDQQLSLTLKLRDVEQCLKEFLEKIALADEMILLDPILRKEYYQNFALVNLGLVQIAINLGVESFPPFVDRRKEDLEFHHELLQLVVVRLIHPIRFKMTTERIPDFWLEKVQQFLFSRSDSLEMMLSFNYYSSLTVREVIWIRREAAKMYDQVLELLKLRNQGDSFVGRLPSEESKELVKTERLPSCFGGKASAQKLPETFRSLQEMLAHFTLPKGELQINSDASIHLGRFGEGMSGTFRTKYEVFIKDCSHEAVKAELLLLSRIGYHSPLFFPYGTIVEATRVRMIYPLPKHGNLEMMVYDSTLPSLPFALVVAWLSNLAEAIQCLHYHKVGHGQICLENCLLFPRLFLKLGHFSHCEMFGSDVEGFEKAVKKDLIGFWTIAIEMLTRRKVSFSSPLLSFAEAIERWFEQEYQNYQKESFGTGRFSRVWQILRRLLQKSLFSTRLSLVFDMLQEELFSLVEGELQGDPRSRNNLSHARSMRHFATQLQESESFLTSHTVCSESLSLEKIRAVPQSSSPLKSTEKQQKAPSIRKIKSFPLHFMKRLFGKTSVIKTIDTTSSSSASQKDCEVETETSSSLSVTLESKSPETVWKRSKTGKTLSFAEKPTVITFEYH